MQELPAIVGQHGREYKISLIHLRTRLKYSEIHPNQRSGTIASVLERAVLRLPPFHLVVTNNAMMFTLAYTAHPHRRTASGADPRPVGAAPRANPKSLAVAEWLY